LDNIQVIKNCFVAVSSPYCRGPATQAQLCGLHSTRPLYVVHLQYQQY